MPNLKQGGNKPRWHPQGERSQPPAPWVGSFLWWQQGSRGLETARRPARLSRTAGWVNGGGEAAGYVGAPVQHGLIPHANDCDPNSQRGGKAPESFEQQSNAVFYILADRLWLLSRLDCGGKGKGPRVKAGRQAGELSQQSRQKVRESLRHNGSSKGNKNLFYSG